MRLKVWLCVSTVLMLTGCIPKTDEYAADFNKAIADEEATHLVALNAAAKSGQLSERNHIASIFISKKVINEAFAGISGSKVEIPKSNAELIIDSADADFRDGFPLINAKTHLNIPGVKAPVTVNAAFELTYSIQDSSIIVIKPELLAVDPGVHVGIFDLRIRGALNELMLRHVRPLLPQLELPIATSSEINETSATKVVTLPAGGSTVTGNVQIPAISAKTNLSVSQVIFLDDGLHVLIDGGVSASSRHN